MHKFSWDTDAYGHEGAILWKTSVGKDDYVRMSLSQRTTALQRCSVQDRVLADIHQINRLNGGLQSCRLPSNPGQPKEPITSLNFFSYIYGKGMCATESRQRSQDNSQELVLMTYRCQESNLVTLDSKHLYLSIELSSWAFHLNS